MSLSHFLIKCLVEGQVQGKVLDIVSEEFFDTAEDRVLWVLLREHYRKTGKVLRDWGILYQVVLNTPGVDERVKVAGRVEWLAGLELGKDIDSLKELLWKEFKEKEILGGIKKVERELFGGKDVEVAVEGLRRVLQKVKDNFFIENGASNVFENVYERLVDFEKGQEEEGLYTGIPSLDVLIYGGLRRGSLTVWVGATSVGKTMMLVWQSVMFMLQGKRVLFITLEDDEASILNRFDRALFYAVKGDLGEVERRIELLREVGGGVEVLFRSRMSIDDLVEEVGKREGCIDVVVVDYGDLVEGKRRGVEDWVEQGDVFERMMGLARREGLWVVTATQASRQALSAKVLTLGHVGRSFRKAQVAQYVMALVQTKEEEEKGLMRVVLLKNKFGMRNQSIVVRVLREYCWFREELWGAS